MARPIDDPDERKFQEYVQSAGTSTIEASSAVKALDERITALKADCRDTEQLLEQTVDTEERNWLIYRLQRQRLLYARYHVRKVGVLKKLASSGKLHLPVESLKVSASMDMTTDNERLIEAHLHEQEEARRQQEAQHSTVFHSDSEAQTFSKGDSEAESSFKRDSDAKTALEIASESTRFSKTGQKPAQNPSTESHRQSWHEYFQALTYRLYGSAPTLEADPYCDRIEPAEKFYHDSLNSKFSDQMTPQSFDDESDQTTTSHEKILFGHGEHGSSADAVIERRDRFRDKREVTDEQIRYIHEHVRSYRLETVLNRDQDAQISADLKELFENDPDLFRKHFDVDEFERREKLKKDEEERLRRYDEDLERRRKEYEGYRSSRDSRGYGGVKYDSRRPQTQPDSRGYTHDTTTITEHDNDNTIASEIDQKSSTETEKLHYNKDIEHTEYQHVHHRREYSKESNQSSKTSHSNTDSISLRFSDNYLDEESSTLQYSSGGTTPMPTLDEQELQKREEAEADSRGYGGHAEGEDLVKHGDSRGYGGHDNSEGLKKHGEYEDRVNDEFEDKKPSEHQDSDEKIITEVGQHRYDIEFEETLSKKTTKKAVLVEDDSYLEDIEEESEGDAHGHAPLYHDEHEGHQHQRHEFDRGNTHEHEHIDIGVCHERADIGEGVHHEDHDVDVGHGAQIGDIGQEIKHEHIDIGQGAHHEHVEHIGQGVEVEHGERIGDIGQDVERHEQFDQGEYQGHAEENHPGHKHTEEYHSGHQHSEDDPHAGHQHQTHELARHDEKTVTEVGRHQYDVEVEETLSKSTKKKALEVGEGASVDHHEVEHGHHDEQDSQGHVHHGEHDSRHYGENVEEDIHNEERIHHHSEHVHHDPLYHGEHEGHQHQRHEFDRGHTHEHEHIDISEGVHHEPIHIGGVVHHEHDDIDVGHGAQIGDIGREIKHEHIDIGQGVHHEHVEHVGQAVEVEHDTKIGEIGQEVHREHDQHIGQGIEPSESTKEDLLFYIESKHYPLIISLDKYPREWYYEDLTDLEDSKNVVEEGRTRYDIEIEDTIEKAKRRITQEINKEVVDEEHTVEGGVVNRKHSILYHLLNRSTDMPTIPFHTKKPQYWSYDTIQIGQGVVIGHEEHEGHHDLHHGENEGDHVLHHGEHEGHQHQRHEFDRGHTHEHEHIDIGQGVHREQDTIGQRIEHVDLGQRVEHQYEGIGQGVGHEQIGAGAKIEVEKIVKSIDIEYEVQEGKREDIGHAVEVIKKTTVVEHEIGHGVEVHQSRRASEGGIGQKIDDVDGSIGREASKIDDSIGHGAELEHSEYQRSRQESVEHQEGKELDSTITVTPITGSGNIEYRQRRSPIYTPMYLIDLLEPEKEFVACELVLERQVDHGEHAHIDVGHHEKQIGQEVHLPDLPLPSEHIVEETVVIDRYLPNPDEYDEIKVPSAPYEKHEEIGQGASVEESGSLLLKDLEFGHYELDHHVHQRPTSSWYDELRRQKEEEHYEDIKEEQHEYSRHYEEHIHHKREHVYHEPLYHDEHEGHQHQRHEFDRGNTHEHEHIGIGEGVHHEHVDIDVAHGSHIGDIGQDIENEHVDIGQEVHHEHVQHIGQGVEVGHGTKIGDIGQDIDRQEHIDEDSHAGHQHQTHELARHGELEHTHIEHEHRYDYHHDTYDYPPVDQPLDIIERPPVEIVKEPSFEHEISERTPIYEVPPLKPPSPVQVHETRYKEHETIRWTGERQNYQYPYERATTEIPTYDFPPVNEEIDHEQKGVVHGDIGQHVDVGSGAHIGQDIGTGTQVVHEHSTDDVLQYYEHETSRYEGQRSSIEYVPKIPSSEGSTGQDITVPRYDFPPIKPPTPVEYDEIEYHEHDTTKWQRDSHYDLPPVEHEHTRDAVEDVRQDIDVVHRSQDVEQAKGGMSIGQGVEKSKESAEIGQDISYDYPPVDEHKTHYVEHDTTRWHREENVYEDIDSRGYYGHYEPGKHQEQRAHHEHLYEGKHDGHQHQTHELAREHAEVDIGQGVGYGEETRQSYDEKHTRYEEIRQGHDEDIGGGVVYRPAKEGEPRAGEQIEILKPENDVEGIPFEPVYDGLPSTSESIETGLPSASETINVLSTGLPSGFETIDHDLPSPSEIVKEVLEEEYQHDQYLEPVPKSRTETRESLRDDRDIDVPVLLWKDREFRASVLEIDRNYQRDLLLEDRKRGILTDPLKRKAADSAVIRRRTTIREDYSPAKHYTGHFYDSEVHELRRSSDELGYSTSTIHSSEKVPEVYDVMLFRSMEMVYVPLVIDVDYDEGLQVLKHGESIDDTVVSRDDLNIGEGTVIGEHQKAVDIEFPEDIQLDVEELHKEKDVEYTVVEREHFDDSYRHGHVKYHGDDEEDRSVEHEGHRRLEYDDAEFEYRRKEDLHVYDEVPTEEYYEEIPYEKRMEEDRSIGTGVRYDEVHQGTSIGGGVRYDYSPSERYAHPLLEERITDALPDETLHRERELSEITYHPEVEVQEQTIEFGPESSSSGKTDKDLHVDVEKSGSNSSQALSPATEYVDDHFTYYTSGLDYLPWEGSRPGVPTHYYEGGEDGEGQGILYNETTGEPIYDVVPEELQQHDSRGYYDIVAEPTESEGHIADEEHHHQELERTASTNDGYEIPIKRSNDPQASEDIYTEIGDKNTVTHDDQVNYDEVLKRSEELPQTSIDEYVPIEGSERYKESDEVEYARRGHWYERAHTLTADSFPYDSVSVNVGQGVDVEDKHEGEYDVPYSTVEKVGTELGQNVERTSYIGQKVERTSEIGQKIDPVISIGQKLDSNVLRSSASTTSATSKTKQIQKQTSIYENKGIYSTHDHMLVETGSDIEGEPYPARVIPATGIQTLRPTRYKRPQRQYSDSIASSTAQTDWYYQIPRPKLKKSHTLFSGKVVEVVRIKGEEYRVYDNIDVRRHDGNERSGQVRYGSQVEGQRGYGNQSNTQAGYNNQLSTESQFYKINRDSFRQRQFFKNFEAEDQFLNQYITHQKWSIPTYLIPVEQDSKHTLTPNKSNISLGVLLKARRRNISAPAGLDRLHIREELWQEQSVGRGYTDQYGGGKEGSIYDVYSGKERAVHDVYGSTKEWPIYDVYERKEAKHHGEHRERHQKHHSGSIQSKVEDVIYNRKAPEPSKTSLHYKKTASEYDKVPSDYDKVPSEYSNQSLRYEKASKQYENDVDGKEKDELLYSRAFQKAKSNADEYTYGSIHTKQGKEVAQQLNEYDKVYERSYDQVPDNKENGHSRSVSSVYSNSVIFDNHHYSDSRGYGQENIYERPKTPEQDYDEVPVIKSLRHVEPSKRPSLKEDVPFSQVLLRHVVENGSTRRKRRLSALKRRDPYVRHPSDSDFKFGLHFGSNPYLIYLARQPYIRGRFYRRMAELKDELPLGNVNGVESLENTVDTEQTALWDPTQLLKKQYYVDYNPLVEHRITYRTMEGHMEFPNDENVQVPEIEKPWKPLYCRIRDGRFQWFASHCADEHPISDVLLTDTKITANKDDWTFRIQGGKENANLLVKAPSNVFEKWRQVLLSQSQTELIDAYVQPGRPVVPHYQKKVVLVEIGAASVRAGLLTNKPSLPQVFFPAIASVTDSGIIVGSEALRPENRTNSQLVRPMDVGDGTSVDRYNVNSKVVDAVVRKVVKELQIKPGDYKILLSISQDVPTTYASQLLHLLLEATQFEAATIARQPSLILYSYDVTTGVVVDIGETLHIVPVIDEYIVDSAIVSLPFGGQQIRAALKRRLQNTANGSGIGFNSPVEHVALQEIVRQSCYVDSESTSSHKGTATVDLSGFKLGDGFPTSVQVDEERHLVAEGLFNPKRWSIETKGIHHLIHEVIQQSPIDSRRTLYRNIYLAGGVSLLPGLAERLEQELSKIAPSSIFVQVHGSPWRYHAAYLGAQVIASSHQFDSCCANKDNIDDYVRQLEAEIN
ncbi:unnamed protein product [Bursaphelenchus okinawaensis]|uniref:Uncharacterized protein n=1 Tax=Bursaphelenchus okinawaensis TaxID=465554 RepID=A0A811KZV1_9BILA|nr:unnamed protein product [Bursaphelenchus okinawaensis]CAG9115051.1 unnamed protein product [Bursaphelenchus okinawaensis]